MLSLRRIWLSPVFINSPSVWLLSRTSEEFLSLPFYTGDQRVPNPCTTCTIATWLQHHAALLLSSDNFPVYIVYIFNYEFSLSPFTLPFRFLLFKFQHLLPCFHHFLFLRFSVFSIQVSTPVKHLQVESSTTAISRGANRLLTVFNNCLETSSMWVGHPHFWRVELFSSLN